MHSMLQRVAAGLPEHWQQELKRLHFRHQIRHQRFRSPEPEYELLPTLIEAGDWVIDVGANVGHYTRRFSELVGGRGRVLAFEPVPATFALLAGNAEHFPYRNVTLFNAAVSDHTSVAGMDVPAFASGLSNYYEAHLGGDAAALPVLCLNVDALALPAPVRLVKIDAEGHEPAVLAGMRQLLERDRPTLIVEANVAAIVPFLEGFGYVREHLADSPNYLFRTKPDGAGTRDEQGESRRESAG